MNPILIDQAYAAVVKPVDFRLLFVIVVYYYNLDIDQLDVKTALLCGLIDQLVYVQISNESKMEETKNMVCKLLVSLYVLEQAPRLWYKRLYTFLLEKLGLDHINADQFSFHSWD